MRLPNSEHDPSRWRISEVVPDFHLEDLWALPVEGDADDFATFLDVMATRDGNLGGSRAAVALFEIRLLLGRLLGWDDEGEPLPIPGTTEWSLRDRLPDDLRETPAQPHIGPAAFVPFLRTEREWAAEISNKTVHAVMHLGWTADEDGDGGHRGQMRVYVKPRGRFGSLYMQLIAPFRYAIVYPAMMRQIGRGWSARTAHRPAAAASVAPDRRS